MAPPPPVLLLLLAFAAALVSVSGDDSATMADLAKSLTGPGWRTSGSDYCTWPGIKCGASGAVVDINLAGLNLVGSVPPSISTLSSLTSLQLQHNSISGPFPDVSGLGSLQRLIIDDNAFSSVPSNLFDGLTSLQTVSLDNLPLAPWTFSSGIGQVISLSDFSASNSSLSGSIPDGLASLPGLRTLRLSYNNLTGGLPSSFAGSGLQSLQLNNQKSAALLSGRIDIIGSMPQLQTVWLQSNAFSGPIPNLSNLTSLKTFNVRDNALTGVIPDSLLNMPSLQNVSLSNNKLQGPFPSFMGAVSADDDVGNSFCLPKPGPCDPQVMTLLMVAAGFGYPTELANSWTGNNACASTPSPWIGVTCDSTNAVMVINFAKQNFSGTISPALANLTSLVKVDLSNNQLTGSIPDSLTTLKKLQTLDVSNNLLTGDVPNFPSTVTLKLSGNRFGQSSGSTGSSSNGSSSMLGGSSSISKGAVAGIVVGVLLVAACCVALFLLFRRKNNQNNFNHVQNNSGLNEAESVKIGVNGSGMSAFYSHSTVDSGNIPPSFVETQGLLMSFDAVREATDNFSESNILGRGGFGIVYRGYINGTLVAVKRSLSDALGNKGQQEFLAELDVLRKVRHRNLVALLGYCNTGAERLLVYEYMPGGTLGEHLFGLKDGDVPLTWKQRLTIALDVARGIEYLHNLAQETFIHRDLKPSNILLDKDLRGKVSDFGLVKLAKDQEKSMMTRLAGTFGYLAPEYAITGKVSTKVDVYAFGVILMEMITGRKALDDSLPDEETHHLVTCFRRNILDKEKFMKFVDQTLDLDEDTRSSLLGVAELARHCTAREPSQRPDMSHCVSRLSNLIDQWKPTTSTYGTQGADNDDDEGSAVNLQQRVAEWRSNGISISTDTF